MTLADLHRSLSMLAASPSMTVYYRPSQLINGKWSEAGWHALFVDTETHAVGIGSGEDVEAAVRAAVEDMRRVVASRWQQERKEAVQ